MAYDSTDFVVTETPVPETIERTNMRRLRDMIAGLPAERFDMSESGEWEDAGAGDCGTAACIGGWARALLRRHVYSIDELAPDLGLTKREATALFYPGSGDSMWAPMSDGRSPYDATPAQAANVLDHYLATGRIDWSVA